MTDLPEKPIQKYMKFSGSDFSGYWLDAYGWIACYFAQLEGLGYALIDLLGSNEDKVAFKKLPFQDRTQQAKLLICAHLRKRGEVILSDEWELLLGEVKIAAPIRNRILHNPLSVNLALGDPLLDPNAGIRLVHEPGQPLLKLGAVQAYADSLHNLNLRMHDLLLRSKLV